MCDAKRRFTLVDVGANGNQSDGGIFKKYDMGKALANHTFNFPPPRPLYEAFVNVLGVVLADAAFKKTLS